LPEPISQKHSRSAIADSWEKTSGKLILLIVNNLLLYNEINHLNKNNMEQADQTDLFDLQLDQSSINFLSETARWSRFLAIIGFIYCGLMILVGIFIGTIMSMITASTMAETAPSMIGTGFSGALIIIVSLLLFLPAYYLFNFSTKMRRALHNNDQLVLNESLKNLKSFFKFYGIFVIVVISFYILLLLAVIFGAMAGHRG
jgi:hypothetical protein